MKRLLLFLSPLFSVLPLTQCSMLGGGSLEGVAAGSQTEVALNSISGSDRRGKVVVVDKRAATVTAFEGGKKQFSFPALLGSARRDDFNKKISAFRQKTTPAIYYTRPQVMYNPQFPGYYKERAVINFDDITALGKTTEVLTFHSTLSAGNDSNIRDGRASNNRISNGCIRVRYPDFLKLVAFMSPGGDLDQLRKAQDAGKPKNLRSVSTVVILPEKDRSPAGTRRALGL